MIQTVSMHCEVNLAKNMHHVSYDNLQAILDCIVNRIHDRLTLFLYPLHSQMNNKAESDVREIDASDEIRMTQQFKVRTRDFFGD
jgi:hypothetical protein